MVSQRPDLHENLTLAKLDMLLEYQYTCEVKLEAEKEQNDEEVTQIDTHIEKLQKENELLKFDIKYTITT